jgi:uncharacterized membrane protein
MTTLQRTIAASPARARADNRRRGLRTTRFEAFSDGVFAIAITLLVLELAVPPGAHEDLLAAVLAQWPSFLAYAVSFSTIGAVWLAHGAITEHLEIVDASLIRLNLLLLMVVSFLPFPTKLLSENTEIPSAERVAATIYGLTLLAASGIVYLLWQYARRAGLIRATSSDEEIDYLTSRLTPGVAGYIAIIAIGLFVPRAAVLGYLAIALFFFVPVRSRKPPTAEGPPGPNP